MQLVHKAGMGDHVKRFREVKEHKKDLLVVVLAALADLSESCRVAGKFLAAAESRLLLDETVVARIQGNLQTKGVAQAAWP